MKIFLIGMPGSGKSTVGRLLANTLGLEFLDLDKYIELKQGVSLSEIFEKEGEDVFRELESAALAAVSALEKDLIISCGGGTPCYNNNMNSMLETGTTVYIDVPLQTLIERTSGKVTRPLLLDNPSDKLQQLLETRLPYFRRAHHSIDANGLESAVVADKLATHFSKIF